VRVFTALPLPREAVDSIAGVIAPIRASHPDLRWVSSSAYHLTIHFFGELSEDAVSSLGRVFEDSRLRRPAFATRFGPLGQFPSRGAPRVLWISVADERSEIRSWWELFESAVAPLGWESDKRGFTPHVTLARNAGSHLQEGWLSAASVPDLRFSLVECVLFQSILGRGGAHYVPLRRISFDGGAA